MAAQAEDIKRLKERLEGHQGPVLSVYLSVNARIPENQGQAYKVRLRDALEEMEVPEELAGRVRREIENQLHPGARTAVFFTPAIQPPTSSFGPSANARAGSSIGARPSQGSAFVTPRACCAG